MRGLIKEGDKVSVHFHSSQCTLLTDAVVRNVPCQTGDSWIFETMDEVHYVSEGCTVTKTKEG